MTLFRTWAGVGEKNSTLTFIVCASETWFDYEVLHQGKYQDICGVKPYWKDFIVEKGIELNSIASGKVVLEYYLEQNDSKRKALLEYKGVVKSAKVKKIVDKIIRLEREYKSRVRILMEEIKENEKNRGY